MPPMSSSIPSWWRGGLKILPKRSAARTSSPAPIAGSARGCTTNWCGPSFRRSPKARVSLRSGCGGAERPAPRPLLLGGFAFAALGRVILTLADAGGLAAAAAQIIQLGATDLAAAHDLHRVDHRRIQREDALDAFTVRNLADGEVLVEAVAGAADANAFIGLNAGALALDHLDVDLNGVARAEVGHVLAGGKLCHLFVFELLEQIHGKFSIGCAVLARGSDRGLSGLGVLLRYPAGFVTLRSFGLAAGLRLRFGALFRPLPRPL